MPAQLHRRMPLSCEPCRERKIRCARSPTGVPGSPCTSCIRRGVPPNQCVFLRDVYARRTTSVASHPHNHMSTHVAANTAGNATGTSNEELLARIHKLEAIVSTGSGFQAQAMAAPAVSLSGTDTSPSFFSDIPSYSPETVSTDSTTPAVRGVILRSASGHERYVPQSSMWSSVLEGSAMADGVDYGWDAFPSNDASSWDTTAADNASKNDEFPFATDAGGLLSSLPAMSHCDELKDLYFDVFAPLFHILHDPTFMADYTRFRTTPDAAPKSWLALLYVVLSVAVPALDTSSPLLHDLGRHSGPDSAARNVAALTSRFRAAAIRCLDTDQYLWRHNMHTLQALLLLVYGINHSHGQSWALLGLSRNIALALGCHIDPDNLVVRSNAGSKHRLDIVAAEQRRRCWAALTMLYVIQNTTLGSIDPTPPVGDGVRLPRDANDDQLVEGGQAVSTPASADLHIGDHAAGPCTQMTYLLYKFRLYGICSRICQELFSGRAGASTSYASVARLDGEIAGLQQTWQRRYQRDTENVPRVALPAHHMMHMHILYGYSHQLRLLLHRPLLLGSQTEGISSRSSLSRSRCIESALALLSIQRTLYESEMFRPFRWYTCGLGSFHAFHAAVLLAYVYGTRGGEDTFDGGIPVSQLHKELEQSVDVCSALAATGMSRISEKAAPVIKRLLQSSLFVSPAQAPIPIQSLTPPSSNSMDADMGSFGAIAASQEPVCAETASQQLEAVLGSLQVHQWLSPGAIQWNDWDVFMPYGD